MRLIDADALIDRFDNLKSNPNNRLQDVLFLDGAMAVTDNAPTIDAVPVVHAKWIPHKPGDVHACSSCGFGVLVSMWFKNGMGIGPRITHNKFRYCPNCGAMMSNAKMDGVPHDDSGQ